RARSYRALAAEVKRDPRSSPSALVEELARAAASYDPEAAFAAREELARRGERGAARVEASSARGARAVVNAANEAFDGHLDDVDEGLRAASVVSHAGMHDAARSLYARLVEWAPNRAEAWAGLADETSATGEPAGGTHALSALQRARELSPGDARIRAELAL